MLISSMGRYAVLILLDLAEHRGGFVPVRQIAERQELSQKYLERILRTLAEHGLVEGTHGKGGGYRLTREPSDYSIGEIIRAADGSLSCLGTNVQLTRCEVSSGLSARLEPARQTNRRLSRRHPPLHPGHRRRSG